MDKMKDKEDKESPSYIMPNSQQYPGQPVGYPDMSGRDPESYGKVMAIGFKPHFYEGPQSHSINPDKNKFASKDEMKQMKLAK